FSRRFCPKRRTRERTVKLRAIRSEEHTSELQSHLNLVCRLLLENKRAYVGRVVMFVCVCVCFCVYARITATHVSRVDTIVAGAALCLCLCWCVLFFFFFKNTGPTEIYTFSLHAAFPF